MNVRVLGCVALTAAVGLIGVAVAGDDIKSGPDKKMGGAFNVKAITGGQKGNTLCYV